MNNYPFPSRPTPTDVRLCSTVRDRYLEAVCGGDSSTRPPIDAQPGQAQPEASGKSLSELAIADHVRSCAACLRWVRQLRQLDAGLGKLPVLEPSSGRTSESSAGRLGSPTRQPLTGPVPLVPSWVQAPAKSVGDAFRFADEFPTPVGLGGRQLRLLIPAAAVGAGAIGAIAAMLVLSVLVVPGPQKSSTGDRSVVSAPSHLAVSPRPSDTRMPPDATRQDAAARSTLGDAPYVVAGRDPAITRTITRRVTRSAALSSGMPALGFPVGPVYSTVEPAEPANAELLADLVTDTGGFARPTPSSLRPHETNPPDYAELGPTAEPATDPRLAALSAGRPERYRRILEAYLARLTPQDAVEDVRDGPTLPEAPLRESTLSEPGVLTVSGQIGHVVLPLYAAPASVGLTGIDPADDVQFYRIVTGRYIVVAEPVRR